jgi:hypothetical protein
VQLPRRAQLHGQESKDKGCTGRRMQAGDLSVKPMQLVAVQPKLYLDTGSGQTTSRPGRHPGSSRLSTVEQWVADQQDELRQPQQVLRRR